MEPEEAIEFLSFGYFQKGLIVIGSIAFMFSGVGTGTMVFLTYTPNYRCALPGMTNDTYNSNQNTDRHLLNLTIPDGENGLCFIYNVSALLQTATTPPLVRNTNTNASVAQDMMMKKCDKWVFDQSVFSGTIVTEYNLVCDRSLVIVHARMVSFVGVLVGNLLLGLFGDMFGRKTAYFTGFTLALICSLIVTWISNPKLYMALLFFEGLGASGAYINMFVILMEFVEKRKRVLVVTLSTFGWVVGLLYAACFAYVVRDWRMRQIAAFCPFSLMLLAIWFVPESIRWLVRHEKYKTAEKVLKRIAKLNGCPKKEFNLNAEESTDGKEGRFVIVKVLTTPELLKRFLIVTANWMTIAMTYFGLTLNAGNITGNVFLEFILSSVIEIPAYILVLLIVDRFGRKLIHTSLMIIGGLACIATILPVTTDKEGLEPLTITLVTIGKAASSAAFHTILIYTPELFPTSMRMSVVGAVAAVGFTGTIVAPFIVQLGKLVGGEYSIIIPILVFGGLSLFTGLLCILLPETTNINLAETVDDAKRFERKRKDSVPMPSSDAVNLYTNHRWKDMTDGVSQEGEEKNIQTLRLLQSVSNTKGGEIVETTN